MNWDDLRVFLALEDAGTTLGAAEQLGIHQSTVSRRLTALDADLGVKLLERRGRNLVPTSAGRTLLAFASQMESLTFEMERALFAAEELRGALRISVIGPIYEHYLAEPLARFIEEHPAITLTIDTSSTLADLDRRDADVVVRATDSPPPELVGRRYGRFGFGLYARHDRLTSSHAIGFPAPRGDLAKAPWFVEGFPHVSVTTRVAEEAAQYHLVRAGVGMAELLCMLAEADPLLVRVPDSPIVLGGELWVLTHPAIQHSAPVRALTDRLHQVLAPLKNVFRGPKV